MNIILMKTVALLAGLGVFMLTPATAQTIVVKNGELLMTGPSGSPRTISGGTVVIEDGVIRAVGRNLAPPPGATVIDADGLPVTPGFFAPVSALGIEEISLNGEGNERRANNGFALSAALRAVDGLNPDSTVIPVSRAGGITRAYVAPDPGETLFGGCGMVIDLSGNDDPVSEDCTGMHLAMGYGGARRTGDTKTGLLAMLRFYLDEALVYDEGPAEYRFTLRGTDLALPDLAALVPYAKGEKPFLVNVSSAADIRQLLVLKEDYGLKLVLVGAEEGWRVAEDLAAANVPVILFPLANLPSRFETMAARLDNAAILQEAGVTIAFYDNDIGYTHNLRLLPQLAGNAVANGLDYQDALAAVTLNPAKIWGLERQLGTIHAGKIADLVIWDGDPLELSSRPQTVIINGEITSLDNRQSALARRYKDLSRGTRPPAWRGE